MAPRYSRQLKVTILCCLWYLMSSANNVIGKKLLKNYPYPLTITLFHMLANSIFMYPVLLMAGLSTNFQYSRHFIWKFMLPLACGKFVGSVLSHISIWKISVSYAHTIKGMLPIFTVMLSKLVYKEKYSTLVYVSLLPIVMGVAIATMTEISFEIYGMISAVLATCTFSIQNLYSKKALREVRLNPLQMLMRMAQLALLICLPLWVFVDSPNMANDVNLGTYDEKLQLFLKLSLSGFINFMQNVVAFSVLHLLSPLSYSVANATKRILVIIVSLISLRNPVTTINFLGMMLAVAGVFCYNRAKIIQNSQKKVLPISSKDTHIESHNDMNYVSPQYRTFKRLNSNTMI